MNPEDSSKTARRPYRILYCEGNTDGTVGGSYFSLLYLVSGLDRSRFEPTVVFRQDNDMIGQFQDAEIDTKVIKKPAPTVFSTPDDDSTTFYRIVFPALRIVQKAINLLRQLPLAGISCALYLRREQIDIVHLNNSIIRNHDWMLGALLSGTKCITHERGINQYYSALSVFLAKRLDAIICISNAVRNSLESFGIDTSSAVTIYNGIDPSIVVPRRTKKSILDEHGLSSDSKLIGIVGNIKEWKGQETALNAMPQVLDSVPDCVCVLVGDVSPADRYYYESLQSLAEDSGIRDNVVFAGYTPDVASYLQSFDVVLHTSTQPEPFGRVLIEAMAMRKPLIGAAAGAVPEVIVDGITGFLFKPGDPLSLATSILRVLQDSQESYEMADRAFDRLTKHFHIDENVSKTQLLYVNVLSS